MQSASVARVVRQLVGALVRIFANYEAGPFVLFLDNLAQRMNKLGRQEDLYLGEYSPVSRNRSSTPSAQQEMAISHYPFPGRRQISYGFALVPCEVKLAGTTFDVQRQWSLQVSDASSIKCFEMCDFGPFAGDFVSS